MLCNLTQNVLNTSVVSSPQYCNTHIQHNINLFCISEALKYKHYDALEAVFLLGINWHTSMHLISPKALPQLGKNKTECHYKGCAKVLMVCIDV